MLQNLKNIYHFFQAIFANLIYGFPSGKLKIIAITGTDGKTTTATLTHHILKTAGFKVALISTVAAFIGDEEIDTGFHVTTPSPFALQRILRRIVELQYEYVVLEVTSHGIDQNRVWGIHPLVAAITNVTHEHLDYHKTFSHYLETKTRLLLLAKTVIINQDAGESFARIQAILETHQHVFTTVSVRSLPARVREAIKVRFLFEKYNAQNCAVAVAIATTLNISVKVSSRAIITFPGVKGRMEEIKNDLGLSIIVDFAHTPNALQAALNAVKRKEEKGKGKIIVVFGCAGLRDYTKRPLMGDVAARLADFAVFTAEDPRTEDIWSIIHQMKSGVKEGHGKIISIPDRLRAIEFAIRVLAKKGDTVIITGKGHESAMCYGRKEVQWSDQEAVMQVIRNQGTK